MSIQKKVLKNGSTRYRVRLYMNGRGSKQICRDFKKKVDAQNFIAETKSRLNKNNVVESKDFEETTFKKESCFWLETNKKVFSPSHFKTASGIVKQLDDLIGTLKLRSLHSGKLFQLQNEFLRKGLKPASVNRKLEVLTSILRTSVRFKRIPYFPADGFRKLKEVRDEIQFWEKEEALDFLRSMREKYPTGSERSWVYLVYMIALNTGLRAGEIWGLHKKDLIQNGELLYVGRQLDRVQKQLRPTKGKKPRRVPLNPFLQDEFYSWISKMKLKNEDLLFKNNNGRPICHDNFKKRVFDVDIRDSGLRPIRFHDMRHTAGTLMVGSGVDVVTVKEILGHKDLQTTMNYVHLLGENLKKAATQYALTPYENDQFSKTNKVLKFRNS